MAAEMTHTLDLLLRLVDTVTGASVTGQGLILLADGVPLHPVSKDGYLLLLNRGRTDFELRVEARGYEHRTQRIRYGELDHAVPQVDLHLVPGREYRCSDLTLILEGSCPGIAELCAVRAKETACLIRAFDPAQRRLTLTNPHALELNRTDYAVTDPDKGCFEAFRILRRISDQQFLLDRTLISPFFSHFPVSPIVFGMTWPDGRYRLRVRDAAVDAQWLVRWTKADRGPRFQTVDLRYPEPLMDL